MLQIVVVATDTAAVEVVMAVEEEIMAAVEVVVEDTEVEEEVMEVETVVATVQEEVDTTEIVVEVEEEAVVEVAIRSLRRTQFSYQACLRMLQKMMLKTTLVQSAS